MRLERLRILFLLIGLFGLALAALPQSQPQTTAQSGTSRRKNVNKRYGEMIYGELENVRGFNPYMQTAARGPTDRLYALIYEGLVRYDADREDTKPLLAASFEQPDSLHVIFYLRPNVTWHDGTPFTAQDVKFTFDFIKTSEQQQIVRAFDFIQSVATPNDLSVLFTFKRPIPEPLPLFDTWIIPRHLFDEHFMERNDISPLSRRPIGTGPYKFSGKTLDGIITMEANENYWGAKANILKVKMNYLTDPTTLINAALFGGVRMVIETPPGEIGRLAASNKYKSYSYQSFAIHVFGYNCTHPILKNPAVRRALTMAVNREYLLKQWYFDKGKVISGPFVPASPYADTTRPLPFNPGRARQVLDGLGYKDTNGDGIRESADGKLMSFRLIIPIEPNAGTTTTINVAQSYVAMLKEIGVEIKIAPLAVDQYLTAMFKDHQFDVAWLKWIFDTSYDITDLFYSTENYPGGNNFISYGNKDVDLLIRGFRRQGDKALRRRIMNAVHKVLAQECPYTFLYTIDNYASVGIQYAVGRIDPYYFFTYFPQWYVPTEFQ